LLDRSLLRLRPLCQAVGIQTVKKLKSELIEILLSPAYFSQTLQNLRNQAKAPATLLPHVREDLEAALAPKAEGHLSISALQRVQARGREASAQQNGQQRPAPQPLRAPEEQVGRPREQGGALVELFTLWHPAGSADARGQRRRPLAELKPGATCKGRVVGVSLHDGLRVDIGAEADALVPGDLSPLSPLAKFAGERGPLGLEVVVQLEEVSCDEGAARRFPLVASLVEPQVPESPLPESSGSTHRAVRVAPGSDPGRLHAARGDGSPAPGMAEAAALAEKEAAASAALTAAAPVPADADAAAQLEAASRAPPRPAPEEVLSLDVDGSLRWVPVPQELRAPAEEVPEDAAQAWRDLAGQELALLDLEMRCRERLAVDLAEVEADLAAGRQPSVPVSMLGLTPADDGQHCLLPRPDGDFLRFDRWRYEDVEELRDWEELEEALHDRLWAGKGKALEMERQEAKEQLRRFFTCREACHARAVRAVEAAELERRADTLAAGFTAMLENDPTVHEVDQGVAASPELKNQLQLVELGGWNAPEKDEEDEPLQQVYAEWAEP